MYREDRSRGRDFGAPREMHKATCAECGKETEVPFKPDGTRPVLEEAFVAPRTPEETILAEIWALVLGLDQVGVRDNFFALGGDSILSIQVMARARERGLSFSLQHLFQHPTIQELAQELGTLESDTIVKQKVEPFSLLSDEDLEKFETFKLSNLPGNKGEAQYGDRLAT